MAFITMNPGYIGRAELPESLKALFRPVSMAAPDLALIAEIMLMAEGFQASRLLARRFVALYSLCESLLSRARHYDWKLRAIKTTLYVAGGMKRASPGVPEDRVLLRALRDFNLGKLAADDASLFAGLLDDLFPGTAKLVPRAVDEGFEAKVRRVFGRIWAALFINSLMLHSKRCSSTHIAALRQPLRPPALTRRAAPPAAPRSRRCARQPWSWATSPTPPSCSRCPSSRRSWRCGGRCSCLGPPGAGRARCGAPCSARSTWRARRR
jgi:hypothetical protein